MKSLDWLRPEPRTWSAATRVTAWGIGVLWLVTAITQLRSGSWRNPANLLTFVVVLLFVAAAAGLLALVLRWLGRTPTTWLWGFLAAALLLALALMDSQPVRSLLAALVAAGALSLLGGGWASLRRSGDRRSRIMAGMAFGVGVLVIGGLVGVLAWGGRPDRPLPNAASASSPLVPVLTAPDPAARGSYPVATLTYGSGSDPQRREFGADATLRTGSFDGSRLVGNWKGRAGWARTRFFGVDVKHLPIQARVYYPQGAGPFPLVLAVHGNHEMEDFSDPGYAYLGELLASRGIVFASVDENFLNSSISDILGIPDIGLDEESDLRGVVLLEHLRAWRRFNQDAGGPLQGKIDLDRIALIGHSRGGEAVSIAAAFNRLPSDPDDGRVRLGYGFGIRAIVAIAQVDGQYLPGKGGTPIDGVSYLALHGSYDGDVTSFDGLRQWSRVHLGTDRFRMKATVYLHRANHGQFNTSWGADDAGGLRGRMLNLAPLVPGGSQRRVAQVYISAFLEATLHDRWEYLPLFRDFRAGAAWLPSGIYLTRLATSADRVICSYQEDLDLETTTMPGGTISAANLADWREQLVPLKSGNQATRAVFLGWNRKEWPGEPATYEIRFPDTVTTRPTTELVFDLADAKVAPSPRDQDRKPSTERDSTDASGRLRQPIDLTLELVDRDGKTARVPLSAVRAVQPQLEARLMKISFLNPDPNSEIVFQSYAFPLSAFGGIDPTRVRAIRFFFDRTAKGVLVLDDVAFREPGGGTQRRSGPGTN
jgi:dienelactone hydrolase